MEPFELSLAAAAAEIQARRLSPVELTESVLDRINATEPALGAFAHVSAELAGQAAAHAEREILAGRHLGPLHGIPLGVKDVYDTAGVPSTAGSKVRADHIPATDAAAVERLLRAGMVLVGKTHTHEFAYGAITPTTRNPWNTGRIPGGSSGGSGAAVAAGSCMVGLGTDSAGSIRIPAALCGTVGLKPTYGRISRRGVTSLSWSLDHVGPLTRTVPDSALVLQALAAHDPADTASVDAAVPDYSGRLQEDITGLRVGVPKNYYFDHVHQDVDRSVRQAIGVLEALGAELREVTIPYPDQIMSTKWAILGAEASAYHQGFLRTEADLYDPGTRLLLEVGALVLATDYIKALRVRTLMQRAWAAMFDGIDVLVTPGTSLTAPEVGTTEVTWPDGTRESVTNALIRLTYPANLIGLPALSVPVGFDGAGLPLGMQVIGRPFDEATVLSVGSAYERALPLDRKVASVVPNRLVDSHPGVQVLPAEAEGPAPGPGQPS